MTRNAIEKLQRFYSFHKRLPSYRELADLFDYQSKSGAYKLANKLEAEGYVRKDEEGKLIPTERLTALKVFGDVTAGFPSPAEEELVDTMSLDEFLVDNREATYVLRVDGPSMRDAGIHDGDLVLVERTDTAKPGRIVVAEVDNEFTMKYLREEDGQYYLEAANPDYDDIYPETDLQIGGVVKGVVRKYD